MTGRTDQLLQIKETTHSKIHPCELEAWVQGRKKTFTQTLKQFPACFYQLHKKGMTHAMVRLQGLHLCDTFRCPNVSTSVGLKLFCPWYLKLGGNTETIAIHLWEVHYMMAIACDKCQAFCSMSTQSILDHHWGWKAKHDKEHVKCEGPTKARNRKKSQGQKDVSQSHGPDAAKKL